MNTLFSKKLLAIVISGLFLGGTLSGEVYALQVNTIEPVTANPKNINTNTRKVKKIM